MQSRITTINRKAGNALLRKDTLKSDLPLGIACAFAFLLLFGCFYGLGSYGLLDDMEGLYAAIARDMLRSGDYVIPRANGVPYFEKPPMLYWLTAFSMKLFGENELAARLPMATATAGLSLTVVWFLHRQRHCRAGIIAGITLLTSPTLLIIGRYLYCDMILTLFITLALTGFYGWHHENRQRWLIFCYSMVALAVLTKGFIAIILTGGTIAVLLVATRAGLNRIRQLFNPIAISAFLLIAAPWHVAAAMQEKSFVWFYFINEHVLRFLGLREPHDYPTGPFWYYLPVLALALFPWSAFTGMLLWRLRRQRVIADADDPSLKPFLWTWFWVVLAFLSLSQAKAYYFLSAGLPPLIMLLALRIEACLEAGHGVMVRHLARIAAALFLAAMAGTMAYFLYFRHDLVALPGKSYWLLLCPDLLAMAYESDFGHCWKSPHACLLPLCLPIVVFLTAATGAIASVEQPLSQKQAALYLMDKGHGGNLALYHDYDKISLLAFYLPGPITIIESTSTDLAYGVSLRQRPELFPSLFEWIKVNEGKPIYLIARNHYRQELKMAFSTLAANERLCLEKQFVRVALYSRCHA